jgi:predicted phage-related endonuclease
MKLLTVTAAAVQHALQQGSRQWHEHRYGCNNASDAAAMLGCDSHRSRADLLHAMYVGFSPDVGSFKQGIYDKGHRYEGLARPLAELIVGEDLYPLVLSRSWQEHGIRRPLGASLDGSTIARKKNWEHKQLNAELAEVLPYTGAEGVHLNDAAALPKLYRVQMEEQMMVNDAEACLFTASAWRDDDTLIDARHCWYYPDAELRAEIVAGWVQWETDYAAYTPVEVIDARPAATGRRPDQLPMLRASAKGELVLESNIKEWEEAALEFIKGVRDHELKTDEDFANADAAAKWCDTSKLTLQGVRANLMSATGDVNTAVATLLRIEDELDKTRIAFERAIKTRKETRKTEMAEEAKVKALQWVRGIEEKLVAMLDHPPRLPLMPELTHPKIEANFGKCFLNKRSFKNMQDALDQELARVKIAASALGDLFTANLTVIKTDAKGHTPLFADWRDLIWKDTEDLRLVVRTRIADHLAEEARRREAEEQRQKNEMALQEIQGIQQQVIIATLGRAGVRKGGTIECIRETLTETEAWTIDADRFGALTGSAQAAKDKAVSEIRQLLTEAEQRAVAAASGQPAAAQNAAAGQPQAAPESHMPQGWGTGGKASAVPAPVVQPIRQQGASRGPATLKLGEINARLSPLQVTAEGLVQLGFPVVSTVQGAKLYHEEDFPLMLDAMQRHLGKVGAAQREKAAA